MGGGQTWKKKLFFVNSETLEVQIWQKKTQKSQQI